MKAASTAKRRNESTKLLVMSEERGIVHTSIDSFADFFKSGDLLIVNRSATLPASFHGRLKRTDEFVEVRLAAFNGSDPRDLSRWKAVAFGSGDWRLPTEERGAPPRLAAGDSIVLGSDFSIEIAACAHERLLDVRFQGANVERDLYQYGKPIQYSYLTEELKIWDQQTLFSGPPISVEPPSASFSFTWNLISRLSEKRVGVASLLHGAGLSSTGSPDLDSLLPLTEWYEIPERTAHEFESARQRGARVVALGTTVLRALESAWDGYRLRSGSGVTSLKISPEYKVRTVDGIVTGLHEDGTSHMSILRSVCSQGLIRRAYAEAGQLGYLGHEYGDVALALQ